MTRLNGELLDRAAGLYTRLVLESILGQSEVIAPAVKRAMNDWHTIRSTPLPTSRHDATGQHHHGKGAQLPLLDPVPELDAIQSEQTRRFARRLLLWPRDRVELAGFGGEMDRVVQMPGWTNVWTMPIQNAWTCSPPA